MAPSGEPRSLYELMLELDRLEELREELDERGIRSVEDLEQQIDELNVRIEALEQRDDANK